MAGTSPQAYLRGLRLAMAKRSLEAGASVAAASEAAGFNSELQLRRAWAAVGWPGHAVRRAALTHSSGGIAVHPPALAIRRSGLAMPGVSDETAFTDTATHRSPP